jgi:hypothetical protein
VWLALLAINQLVHRVVFTAILLRYQQIIHKVQPKKTNDSCKTWTTFTYYSPQIRKITNLFKNTNTRIAFRSTNTIKHLMKRKTNTTTPDYDKSGIYKIKCNTCHRSYIGQTKRSLKLCYQEHIRYIRNNNPQLVFALQILNNRHEYGPMHNTMKLLKQINKTKFLIPYEQLYIQSHHYHNRYMSKIAVNTTRCTNWFMTNRSSHTLKSPRTFTQTLKDQ